MFKGECMAACTRPAILGHAKVRRLGEQGGNPSWVSNRPPQNHLILWMGAFQDPGDTMEAKLQSAFFLKVGAFHRGAHIGNVVLPAAPAFPRGNTPRGETVATQGRLHLAAWK